MEERKEEKIKSWKLYLWAPKEAPRKMAKRGGIILGVMGLIYFLTQGSLVGDLSAIAATYGEVLIVVALFRWIKNKIKK